jgi:hypothetical protein
LFKQIRQGQTLQRRIRMQGESPPFDVDIIFLLQFFNTPGNEIAPGSDIV